MHSHPRKPARSSDTPMLPFQRHQLTHPRIQSMCPSLTRVHHAVWSPHEIGLINSIESVQRSFTKRLPGLRDTSYADRLSILKLQSLEHRRLITDLITCYNIIHDRCSLEFANFFTFSNNPSSRGHPLRLFIPLVKTNSAKYIFSSRVVQPWNSLPADAVTATNVRLFRLKLTKLNLSNFLTIPTFIHI